MSWGTTAPAAMAKLVTVVGGRVAALAVPAGGNRPQVKDGAQVSSAGTKEAIDIGYQGEDAPTVEAALDPATSISDLEEYTINCAVLIWKGHDLPAARARAFELLNVVGGAVKADSTLGDTVMRAWVSSWSLEPRQTTSGALVTLLFHVTVQAYTTT